MTLGVDEFICRFLLHTLPNGFHRIRHYGFLANGHRAAKLDLAQKLLDAPLQEGAANVVECDAAIAISETRRCPCCGGDTHHLAIRAKTTPTLVKRHLMIAPNVSTKQGGSASAVTRRQLPVDRHHMTRQAGLMSGALAAASDRTTAYATAGAIDERPATRWPDGIGRLWAVFSSLSQHRNFSFDSIKVDRSFVAECVRDPKRLKIIRAILNLGGGLGIRTTDEGIRILDLIEKSYCNFA